MKTTILLILLIGVLVVMLVGCGEKGGERQKEDSGKKPAEIPESSATPKRGDAEEPGETPEPGETHEPGETPEPGEGDEMPAMDTSKSPTFGPILLEYSNAIKEKDFDGAWDILSTASHDWYTRMLRSRIVLARTQVNRLGEALRNPPMLEREKAQLEEQYRIAESELWAFEAMEGDGKKYFIWMMTRSVTGGNIMGEYEVIGEEIDGDKGWITTEIRGMEYKIYFAKEDGIWKYDVAAMMGAVPRLPKVPDQPPPDMDSE